MRTMPRSLAVTAVLTLGLAACGDDGDEPNDETAAPTDEAVEDDPDDTPEDDEPTDAAEDATVATSTTDLGEVLVDGEGMTLYVFDPDEQGPSTCEDDCAEAWPPLIAEEPVAGEGVDESLLGTAERPDGASQVTYDGWPLYGWASDQAPGDTTGQGVQDVWWVIAPDGAPLRDADGGDEESDQGGDEGDDRPSY